MPACIRQLTDDNTIPEGYLDIHNTKLFFFFFSRDSRLGDKMIKLKARYVTSSSYLHVGNYCNCISCDIKTV